MGNSSILIVEDEQNVARFIQLELEHEGYEVMTASDGEEAFTLFQQRKWDLLLLDWMIPKLDGLEVCRRIRKNHSTPIIIITARDYIGDKIAGLDTGADDYLTKPFEIEELLARIRSLLRRSSLLEKDTSEILKADSLVLDVNKHLVHRDNLPIQLTQKEFMLLKCMLEYKDEVLTREKLLDAVWGYAFFGETNVVDVYIRYLRNKIDKDFQPKLIHTVRGVGYVLRVNPQEF